MTATTFPSEQVAAALAKGNRYRIMQADFRRSLKRMTFEEGKRVAVGVIREPAPELGAMRVEAVLKAIRAVGPEKALAYGRQAQVSVTRRLDSLTANERERLLRVLA